MLLIIDFDWLVSSGIYVCFSSSAILRLLSKLIIRYEGMSFTVFLTAMWDLKCQDISL